GPLEGDLPLERPPPFGLGLGRGGRRLGGAGWGLGGARLGRAGFGRGCREVRARRGDDDGLARLGPLAAAAGDPHPQQDRLRLTAGRSRPDRGLTAPAPCRGTVWTSW